MSKKQVVDLDEYNETFVSGLEWMWGEGFMSPGGPAEVAAILNGVDVQGKHVLDIGCGIGGIDILLVKTHGAAMVTGTDVDGRLVSCAQEAAERAGLAQQVFPQLVEPGPLPFPNNHFDIVFSKDSILHIPDKEMIYREIYRVLKPGGWIATSDWYGSTLPKTKEYDAWFAVFGLDVEMAPIEEAAELITAVGFVDVTYEDRNQWYAQNMEEELAAISGENYEKLVAALGTEAAEQRLTSSTRKKVVVNQGLLRPGHVRGRKP